MDTILVTGATGTVGGEVVRLLREHPYDIRATITDGEAIPEPPTDRVTYVLLDFLRPETYAPALDGVDKIFLMRPPAIANTKRFINPFINAARDAGVTHIVFMSLLGAEKNPVVPHRHIEDYLKEVGVPYTFLRPSFFMQNLSTTHRDEIRLQSEIVVPAGKGKTSFIDARDIAAVAVKTLTEAGHEYKAYSLTGDEALDYFEVAETFSRVLNRPVRYAKPSLTRFLLRALRRGVPLGFSLIMGAIYTTARLGLAAQLTPDTCRLLGRPPISLEQFVRDYRSVWANP